MILSCIMAENEDEVLSLVGNDSDFSGFGPKDVLLGESVTGTFQTNSAIKKKKKENNL